MDRPEIVRDSFAEPLLAADADRAGLVAEPGARDRRARLGPIHPKPRILLDSFVRFEAFQRGTRNPTTQSK